MYMEADCVNILSCMSSYCWRKYCKAESHVQDRRQLRQQRGTAKVGKGKAEEKKTSGQAEGFVEDGNVAKHTK